ncbi:MAG: PTS sugar transporter subunit IIB [Halorhabdus sp.]
MAEEKNVLIVCGTGIATSTVVREKLKKALPENGINVGTIDKAKATEAPGKAKSGKYDMIVTTTALKEDRYDLPIYHTTAFMSGIGQDEAIDDIVEILNSN